MVAVLLQVWRSEAVKTKKRLGRWYHSDLRSLFSAVAMKSLLTALPFILTHPSNPAWRIPWTEEPGGLQSMGCKELEATE